MARPRQDMTVTLTLSDENDEPHDIGGSVIDVALPRPNTSPWWRQVTLTVWLTSDREVQVLRDAQAGRPPAGVRDEEG